MSVLLIKILFLIIIIFTSSFLVGNIVCCKMAGEKSINRSLVYGFTVLLALFELMSIPAIVFNISFRKLIFVFSVSVSAFLVISLLVFIKKSHYKEYSLKNMKNNIFGKFIIAVLVGIQVFASIYLEHTDADDGYYVTISNIAVEQNVICLEGDSVYHGTISDEKAFRPEVAAWELFVGYLCKMVDVHPAIMCHTMLPAILIVLCYMAVYELSKKVLTDKKNIISFIILFAILNMFSGYSVHSTGCFLLLRLWQGKAMLVNFAFPMLILNCIEIYEEKDSIVTWCMNFAIVCMGTMFTVVGIYLMPIFYFIVGAPLIIKRAIEKQGKKVFKLIKCAFVSMIPIIVILLYMFYKVVSSASGQSYLTRQAPTWIGVFNTVYNNKTMFVLLVISMIIIFIKGNVTNKLIFIGSPVLLALTFLNPLLCDIVAKNITGVDVYWRLYWMIPLYIIISYAFVLLCNEARKKAGVLLVIVMLLAFSGEFIYSEKYFTEMTNLYKLPTEVVDIGENVPEGSKCMLPDNISYYLRQYTSKAKVLNARGTSVLFEKIGDTDYTYSWLYDQIYTYGLVNEPLIINLLKMVEVDYVYYPNADIIKGENENIIRLDGNGALVKIQ